VLSANVPMADRIISTISTMNIVAPRSSERA
jgi:hypothetical protein